MPEQFEVKENIGRSLPHDIDAERSILGAILLQPDVLDTCIGVVCFGDFYIRNHELIFIAMTEMQEKGEPIDEITLCAHLKSKEQLAAAGGVAFVASLTESVPTSVNVEHYAYIVRAHGFRRRVVAAGNFVVRLARDPEKSRRELADAVDTHMFAVTDIAESNNRVTTMRELGVGFVKDLETRFNLGTQVVGLASGLKQLDHMTAGLQGGELFVIAGRPSMGKTALALNIIQHVSVKNMIPVVFFSLEMSKKSLFSRLVCAEGNINSHRVRVGEIKPRDWEVVDASVQKICAAPIYVVDDGDLSMSEIRAQSRRLAKKHGIRAVFVDYLQLIRNEKKYERRDLEVSEITRALKAMAKELDVPVVVLSQLNRGVEQRTDKRPVLSDLRESGAIEQEADIIAMIYRDEYYNKDSDQRGFAELSINKQRNGPTGSILLRFVSESMRFMDDN